MIYLFGNCSCVYQKGGGTIDLEPCLTHSSTLEPTLAPVAVERTMTTRAAASVLMPNCLLLELFFIFSQRNCGLFSLAIC